MYACALQELTAKEASGSLGRNERRHPAYKGSETTTVYDPDEPLVRKSLQKSTAFDPTEKPDSAMLGATVRDLSLQLANSDNNNNNNNNNSSSSSDVLANGDSSTSTTAGVKPKVSTVLDAVVEIGKPSARYWGALYGL
eukprot:3942-Heterococcus_DN1.PRE.1